MMWNFSTNVLESEWYLFSQILNVCPSSIIGRWNWPLKLTYEGFMMALLNNNFFSVIPVDHRFLRGPWKGSWGSTKIIKVKNPWKPTSFKGLPIGIHQRYFWNFRGPWKFSGPLRVHRAKKVKNTCCRS